MGMLWGILGGIAALVALAAAGEAWLKRNRHRALSHLGQDRRRHDDPNAADGVCELDVATYMNCCTSISGKSWKIADTPEEYTKAMMPITDKGQPK